MSAFWSFCDLFSGVWALSTTWLLPQMGQLRACVLTVSFSWTLSQHARLSLDLFLYSAFFLPVALITPYIPVLHN